MGEWFSSQQDRRSKRITRIHSSRCQAYSILLVRPSFVGFHCKSFCLSSLSATTTIAADAFSCLEDCFCVLLSIGSLLDDSRVSRKSCGSVVKRIILVEESEGFPFLGFSVCNAWEAAAAGGRGALAHGQEGAGARARASEDHSSLHGEESHKLVRGPFFQILLD